MTKAYQNESTIERSNAEVADKHRSPLERSMTTLGEDITALHNLIEHLEHKLAPIVVSVPRGDSDNSAETSIATSEVVGRITSMAYQVRFANERIKNLIDTTEI